MRQHHLHVGEFPPCRMQDREPRGVGLDRETRLDELQRADLIDKVAVPAVGGGHRPDERAAAEPPRYEARPLELIERVPHRAACGVEGLRKLAFGRKPVAFAIGAGLDGPLQIGEDCADAAMRLVDSTLARAAAGVWLLVHRKSL
jgi:hypothetical protein